MMVTMMVIYDDDGDGGDMDAEAGDDDDVCDIYMDRDMNDIDNVVG